jgi:hypothetical protein
MNEQDDDHFGDLVGETAQAARVAPPSPRPLTSDDVREKMLALIAVARAASAMPFEPRELQKHIAMFPIMAQWLPKEEGEQLVLQFEAEVERLRQAA